MAFETGEAVTYGLFNAQERGVLFIGAGTPVYLLEEDPGGRDLEFVTLPAHGLHEDGKAHLRGHHLRPRRHRAH